MKKHIFIGLISTLLVACDTQVAEESNRYEGFPSEKSLVSETILLDTAYFRYPYRMFIDGDMVIIHDLHNTEKYLHAYNLTTGGHITSFLSRGGGPDEMSLCGSFKYVTADTIWAYEPNKLVLHRWSLKNGKANLEEVIELDKNIGNCQELIVTDKGFIVPDYSAQARFRTLNKKGMIESEKGSIPTEREEAERNMAMAQAWRPFMDYNKKSGILVAATQLGEVLEIYNLKKDAYIVKYGPGGEPVYNVTQQGHYVPTGIVGFSDVKITDNYIYTVFDGITMEEIGNIYKSGGVREQGGKFIYVFDHNGKPVMKYTLDHPIQNICINEKEGLIYGFDVNQDDPLLVFRL